MQTITDDIDFLKFLGNQESQYIISPASLKEETRARLAGNTELAGDRMPWSKTHGLIAFRPSEVTVWGAYNGHGKSLILGMICAWNLLRKKWLIASMEMKPAATMERMVKQVAGRSDPSPEYSDWFHDWSDGKLWIYDQLDTVQAERILGMVHYAAQELGVNHIIIDSLMKCGFKGSRDAQSSQQVDFVNRLCWAAKSENIHIHLVHHMRKGEGVKSEYIRPGKHDFRGAGEIVDLVDNALIIHRNKKKERALDGMPIDDPERAEIEQDCDATLECCKQRHGTGWEGIFKFWFHDSQQYTPTADNRPIPYDIED